MFYKIGDLKTFANSQEKTCLFLFNKVADLQAGNFIEKRLRHKNTFYHKSF